MCVHSVSRQLKCFALCAGLMLPIAMVQLFDLSPSFGSGHISFVKDVAEPYCQFQGACLPESSAKAMAQSLVGTPYCQFQDACSSTDA